ncbi:MAG TPA: ATP-binding cassette domain-containing protein [Rugosimonospora sp.]|nr:ATP-binding cassette domain-containing protein [Rugosimonospora sp.]
MIETWQLRKSFRSRKRVVRAVRGVSLAVPAGQIFGFLGSNGAGKTTTMRMLVTLIRPDQGIAVVAGADVRKAPVEVRRRIGYVSQGGGTWADATPRTELVDQARLYGISAPAARDRVARIVADLDLAAFADRPCRTLSGGQRRRVDIAMGVVHAPRVVFLDEPTTGLDPQSRAQMWDELRRLRDHGMTIFLTTHYLDEADALCDRIAIMDGGVVVAEGTPDELKRQISGDVVTVGLNGSTSYAAHLLAGARWVHELEADAHGLRFCVGDGATAVPEVMRVLDGHGIRPGSIEVHRPSLDDVFLAKTGRSLSDGKG